ncbi:DUF1801 domain-containing protein [Adhaeribacter rhizoryzae]|uniref:DUF1801 domain-containing protein n=1 Tax=Adhaeribacter rhizoryzae TaxID=2607907 RepID=A0A5M6DSV6_9BACT|nr:DUF1801 domain-containing protein [Adhaeribacter rhizoryzae]KAA5549220.1 DUF1801 domain-containing protein [Adhaeribacter rhizoryzae]
MISTATTPQEYLETLEPARQQAMGKLRDCLLANLPAGFTEVMNYGMIGYVVPHALYAPGYHCNPTLPLPFISIASQKNFIALYHMGLYANADLLAWFVQEYPKHVKTKLDMGESCIRFKRPDQIPYDLIGDLATRLTPQDWIKLYESQLKK